MSKLLVHIQMQEIHGVFGYFLEGDEVTKKKQLQTLKLTEVTASDKLESFRAVKKVLKGHIALGNAQFPNGTNGRYMFIFLQATELGLTLMFMKASVFYYFPLLLLGMSYCLNC
nr:uncharacterized protein LOC112491996 isoform X3 [Ziziphus jujuba var. spinosa]